MAANGRSESKETGGSSGQNRPSLHSGAGDRTLGEADGGPISPETLQQFQRIADENQAALSARATS
jgi:hypothetical protein